MKAVITTILLLLILTNCKNRKTKTVAKKIPSDTTIQTKAFNAQTNTTDNQIDTMLLHIDSARILGERYLAIYKTNDTLYVLNAKSDTILKAPDLHPNFEFDDFNGDGLKDIRIHYLSNVPAVQDLLLFDKSKKNFVLVNDFSKYPDPNPLKGTKYYYSYHRSGCADMNWDSDLFYINNFKVVRIGNVVGYECENRDIKDGIYIHKIKGDKEILFQRKPIETIQKFKEYKWGFIKDYWTKNYKLFM
jgi:hypothetical protein